MSPRTNVVKLLFLLLSLTVSVLSDTIVNLELDKELKDSPTQLSRLTLLSKDSDWVFDFTKQPGYTYSPGSVVNANAASFPATIGNGMTMAMLNLGPCAMLPPHYHPRASNYVVAITGTTSTWMFEENGARLVKETLSPGQMTIFPAGSLHSMQNLGCGNATLISALNSEDAGTQTILNAFFQLPDDIIKAALGGVNFDIGTIMKMIPAIGTGSILGSAACLAACQGKV